MRTVVVHCDRSTAAATGLFGLLCDAIVQIVDVVDEEGRAKALLDLARDSEDIYRATVKQDFQAPDLKPWTRSWTSFSRIWVMRNCARGSGPR